MNLSYNKEINLSEVTFPEGFIFQKNSNNLYLQTRYKIEITVYNSGIKIVANKNSIFIERDEIVDISIDTNFVLQRSATYIPFYKIIVTFKRKKNTQQLELFSYDKFESKIFVLFLIQEFKKILNFPLKNSSENEDIFDTPNCYSFDIIKNDHQNLIIQKKSLYTLSHFIRIIFLHLYVLLTTILFCRMIFQKMQNDIIYYGTFSYFGRYNGVFILLFFFIVFDFCITSSYYQKQGLQISINPFQISISKLKFLTSSPSNPKIIEIDRNINLGIITTTFLSGTSSKVVLYQNNDFIFKKPKRVLIDNITKEEAEYLVKKIRYLANKNNENELNINNINSIRKTSSFILNFVCFIFIAISFIFGIPIIMLEIANARIESINESKILEINELEILNSHVLMQLGYEKREESDFYSWYNDDSCTYFINIPDSYDYQGRKYYIKKIGEKCFYNSKYLSEIYLQGNILVIEKEAFADCPYLKLSIPKSVIKIGENAFRGVKHINYHGNAKGAPWGAQSMN